MASSTTLRVINHRLTTIPVNRLPYLVDFLASSLGECGDILSASPHQKNGQSEADNALQVHKLKTRVTSLLLDRTIEGRWSAIILIKALVEAGQWEILRESEPWVHGLLNILAVSQSPTGICRISLTRYRVLETRPDILQEAIHYHTEPNIQSHLSIPDPSSGDHHTISSSLHNLIPQPCFGQTVIRTEPNFETRGTIVGGGTACFY